ncbi:hypothetical protein SAMN06265365_102322 [Tistlia consotensis]|uniref:Uncharacterized protein n=1 Tax=Tistlia consotensis USBA 355 TaxID=560819 RepID=A0A1Y6C6L1_9PROT|nr:hypothetical protein [Tistlia consotensis]SMF39481.1 hypothetical protein SAMN05428998_113141 [Tistlia consotensis USBA 355]SNR36358.1 hypothetical protein SAMN06265365_102322 [Tistlia consotensis]
MSWPLPEGAAERLALALDYPYDAPERSYLFASGAEQPIEAADYRGRRPVLAHGSNRAPAQLLRKFGAATEIPVTYAWLRGYDVVYAAHVTRYGAVSSTLQRAPGCRVRVALTWLDEAQLVRMHETEGAASYPFGSLERVALEPEAGPGAERLACYVNAYGSLADDGRPLGLALLRAEGRPHGAVLQRDLQERLRARHHPAERLDDHVLALIDDEARRKAFARRLRAQALPLDLPDFVTATR